MVKYTESAFSLKLASPLVEDSKAILALASLIQKMRECVQSMSVRNVEQAAAQHSVVEVICQSRPLFCNFYGTLPMGMIFECNERNRLLHVESVKAQQDVDNLKNLVGRMITIDDLIVLTPEFR